MNIKTILFSLLLVVGLNGCSSSQYERPCTSVASFLIPPDADGLYPVMITHIDDKPVPARAYYDLPAGRHKITVAELISAPSLEVSLKFRNTKTLISEMESGKRYHLAAKFNKTMPMPAKSPDFWRVVEWKKETFPCKSEPISN